MSLAFCTIAELLAKHSEVLDELRRRGVVRSKNNPTGDYTEWLVSKSLCLSLESNSAKGFDAKDADGLRYQIKGRRVTPGNKSTQLGVIRNLDDKDFDFLVAVIFNEAWQVQSAAVIPHQVIRELSSLRQHVNGHVMHLRPSVLSHPSVRDISDALRS